MKTSHIHLTLIKQLIIPKISRQVRHRKINSPVSFHQSNKMDLTKKNSPPPFYFHTPSAILYYQVELFLFFRTSFDLGKAFLCFEEFFIIIV